MAQNFIERLKQAPVLCDGAMGTLLYARGIFINRCYDELNLSQPELIRAVHHDYLQAGAEIIETNTFGGNSFRLGPDSLAARRGRAREPSSVGGTCALSAGKVITARAPDTNAADALSKAMPAQPKAVPAESIG